MKEKELLKLFTPTIKYTQNELCYLTNETQEEIKMTLEKLLKKDKIEYEDYEVGTRRFKLIMV
jgi:ribosomal protein L7Ae-like RNA K-turn-binding protein